MYITLYYYIMCITNSTHICCYNSVACINNSPPILEHFSHQNTTSCRQDTGDNGLHCWTLQTFTNMSKIHTKRVHLHVVFDQMAAEKQAFMWVLVPQNLPYQKRKFSQDIIKIFCPHFFNSSLNGIIWYVQKEGNQH